MSAAFAASTEPFEVRFWSRVDRRDPSACWPWMGWKDHAGYGGFSSGTTTEGVATSPAHRIAYILVRGPIPDGLVLDHLCRNPGCVNPSHLDPVTSGENTRRSPLVVKDACVNGHPYAEGSFYLDRGRRQCRACKLALVRQYEERTGRGAARYTCEHCGADVGLKSRSLHLRRHHPEFYVPRAKSQGITPERQERRLAQQRERRRAAAAARRAEMEASA